MPQKKTSTAVCDFIDGSRKALNFAGDVAVDASVGIGIGIGVAAMPEASLPAIIGSSIAGQAILSNLFTGITDPAKSTLHGLTEKLVPDSCKPDPIVIPMGELPSKKENACPPCSDAPSHAVNKPKTRSHKPRTPNTTKANVINNYAEITTIMINLGVSESQIKDFFVNHKEALTAIDKKLDKVLEWQDKQDAKNALQDKYEGYQSALALCGALSELGKAIGCKELAQGAAILGAGVQIGLGIAMCAANPIMGAALIIGGIASLFGLFSSPGPDPHQLILDQIGKLSEQISAMHGDMIKLFDQNFKMQKIILEVMQQGNISLMQLVKGEVGSLRANMQATLERMETMLRDLSKQVVSGQQQLYLKDFVHLQSQVDDYIQGRNNSDNIQHQIKLISNEITTWSTRHTISPLLNGADWKQIESVKTNPEVLNSLLAQDPSISASNTIGYFNPELPNPAFWLSTVSLYTKLTENFWNINFDQNQQESIKNKGVQLIKYCDDLNQNDQLWNEAIAQYYQSLQEIQKTFRQFAEQRNRIWLSNYNRNYTLNEKRKLDASEINTQQSEINPDKFNFSKGNVDTLLSFFAGRLPNHIQLTLHNNQAEFINIQNNNVIGNSAITLPVLEGLNSKRIYQNISFNREILCAEYLGLLNNLSVTQEQSISGLNKKIGVGKKNKWALILSESAGEYNTENNWQLSLKVAVEFKGENPKAVEMLTFQAPWSEVTALPKFWDDKRQKDDVGEFNEKPLMFLDSEDTKKHLKHHVERIKDELNSTKPMICNISNNDDPAQETRTKIEYEIIKLRQVLAKEILHGNISDDAHGQAVLEQLKKQMVTLDYTARYLQHLLYLAGKNLNGADGKLVTDKIVTSDKISTSLHKYAMEKDLNKLGLNKPEWLSLVDEALLPAKQFTAKAMIGISGDVYPAHHPKSIAQRGLLLLDLNDAVIQAVRLKFPLFAQYVSLQRYQSEESKRYVEEALREIYKLVEATFATKYTKARFRIEEHNLQSVDKSDYKKFYYAFLQWCRSTSKEKHFIGEREAVRREFVLKDGWQTLVRLKIERGWEKNIAALYEIACLVKNKNDIKLPQSTESEGLVNYIMWRDGMTGIIKMLSHPAFSEVTTGLLSHPFAEVNENQVNVIGLQIDHLNEILNNGEKFYQIIENIALSPVVDKIFNHYLETYNQLKEVANDKKKQNDANDQALYDLLVDTQFAGSTIKLLDSLDADRLLLKSYCEMILGFFPWDIKFKSFLTKDQFLNLIKPDSVSKVNLIEKLDQYQKSISTAKEEILDLFKQVRELVALRESLLAMSRGEKNNIISIDGSTLIINSSQFQFGFDELKARILDVFLGQIKGINGLQFIGEDFSKTDHLKAALFFINRHPEIHTLGLCDSNLSSNIIRECLGEFSQLHHIHQLDLSKNSLIDNDDDFAAQVDVNSVCDLLSHLPTLNQLNLNQTGIGEQTLPLLKYFLKRNPNITTSIQYTTEEKAENKAANTTDLSNVTINRLVCVGPPSLENDLSAIQSIKTVLEQRREIYKSAHLNNADKNNFTKLHNSGAGLFYERKPDSTASTGLKTTASTLKLN